jgi:hypothetical protein
MSRSATTPEFVVRSPAVLDAVCRHDGDVWSIEHRGRSARLRDAKGLHDLAALLARPGEDIHVLDLADSAIRGRHSTVPVLDPRPRPEPRTSTGGNALT